MQMKIAVTSTGMDLDAPTSPVFGRCPAYVLVDTETLQFEAVANPALSAPSGAGIQAAQLLVERGAQAVVTGNVGPNAFNVFQAAGLPIYLFGAGTVREAVEAFKAGELQSVAGANVQAGTGMGRGLGRGRAHATGVHWSAAAPPAPAAPPPTSAPSAAREDDVVALQNMAGELQRQLAKIMERLDRLQGEG
jgi:predicted Fe-Mo cluster-binding NifX family protein